MSKIIIYCLYDTLTSCGIETERTMKEMIILCINFDFENENDDERYVEKNEKYFCFLADIYIGRPTKPFC